MSPIRQAAAEAARKSAEAVQLAEALLQAADIAQAAAKDEEMAEKNASPEPEKGMTGLAATIDRVQWPLPSPVVPKSARVNKETVTFDLSADGDVDELFSEGATEFLSLPPRPTDSSQTSLHSFMAAVPGTKSEITGSKGRYRKARLAEVDTPKRDRSRSPVPSSSEEEKEVVKQCSEEGSTDGDLATVGFGAATVAQKSA